LSRNKGGENTVMDIAQLARAQAVNRMAFGAGLMLLPSLFARVWIGSGAVDDGARVLARAVGARDLALGAAGLLALREGHREWGRRTFAAQAFADAVDLVALATPWRQVPLPSRLIGGTLAAGSAAVAGAYARELRTEP
jgi:hypothetical protein